MKVGDTVRFTREVVRRCGYDGYLAEMRGKFWKSSGGRVGLIFLTVFGACRWRILRFVRKTNMKINLRRLARFFTFSCKECGYPDPARLSEEALDDGINVRCCPGCGKVKIIHSYDHEPLCVGDKIEDALKWIEDAEYWLLDRPIWVRAGVVIVMAALMWAIMSRM